MSSSLHPDSGQIISRLKRERIAALYHFTSVDNLPLIREFEGLASKQLLEEKGLWPCPSPGGNRMSHELDVRNGNWDRISLNLTPHTPMAYHVKRAKHLCFLICELDVAGLNGVSFADTNATATGHNRAEGLVGIDLIDYSMVSSFPQPWNLEWKRKVQAEVLIPQFLPIKYVSSIAFVSKASLQEGERLWGHAAHPPFIVEPKYFADSGFRGNVSVGFPYLGELVLTDTPFDKSKVGQMPTPVSQFRRQTGGRITLVARVNATAGTKAQTSWQPSGITSGTEFEKSAEFWHWPSVAFDDLMDGPQEVEYQLNGIRWLKTPFEVSTH